MGEQNTGGDIGAELVQAMSDEMFYEPLALVSNFSIVSSERQGTGLVRIVMIDGDIHEFTASPEMLRQQAALDAKYPPGNIKGSNT